MFDYVRRTYGCRTDELEQQRKVRTNWLSSIRKKNGSYS